MDRRRLVSALGLLVLGMSYLGAPAGAGPRRTVVATDPAGDWNPAGTTSAVVPIDLRKASIGVGDDEMLEFSITVEEMAHGESSQSVLYFWEFHLKGDAPDEYWMIGPAYSKDGRSFYLAKCVSSTETVGPITSTGGDCMPIADSPAIYDHAPNTIAFEYPAAAFGPGSFKIVGGTIDAVLMASPSVNGQGAFDTMTMSKGFRY